MRKVLSLVAIGVALSMVGCDEQVDSGPKLKEASTKSAVTRDGGAGPDLGTAELQPAMSAKEADARVGSAMKKQ